MPRIGYSVNIDSQNYLGDVGLTLVEPQLWRYGPTDKRFAKIERLRASGRVVESLHLRSYREEAGLSRDLSLVSRSAPYVRRVVTHTPRKKYVAGSGDEIYRGFLGILNMAVSQTGVSVGIENTKGGLFSNKVDLEEIKRILESYGQEKIGFVIDSSHIPLTNNRERNTQVFLDFARAAGSRLLEVQLSEGHHRKLDGSLFDWEKIMHEIGEVPAMLEMIGLEDVCKSLEHLRKVNISFQS